MASTRLQTRAELQPDERHVHRTRTTAPPEPVELSAPAPTDAVAAIANAPAGHSASPRTAAAVQRLQRTYGNRAVQRLLLQRQEDEEEVQKVSAPMQRETTPVQRFAFENPDWRAATTGKRSASGMGGVLFFEDGSPNPLVVKKSATDPVGESLLMGSLQEKVGGRKGGKVPKTRVPSQDERYHIAAAANRVVAGWRNAEDKEDWLNALSGVKKGGEQASNFFVMGKAEGEEFEKLAHKNEWEAISYLNNPTYIYNLGVVHAVDMFLGNTDRLLAMNTGNWMTDTAGRIALIDNFDPGGAQRLLQEGGAENWNTVCLPQLLDPDKAAKDVYKEALVQAKRNERLPELAGEGIQSDIFLSNFARGVKDGRSRILSALAPRIGWRSRSLKKQVLATFTEGKRSWEVIKERARAVREKRNAAY